MIKYFKLKHNIDLNAFSSITIIVIIIIVIIIMLLLLLIFSAGELCFIRVYLTRESNFLSKLEKVLVAELERYHSSLKEDYYTCRGAVRRYHAADCVGQQTLGKRYWCLSSEVMHQPIW